MQDRRARATTRAIPAPDRNRLLLLAAGGAVLFLLLFLAGSAQAQFPRIGISASPDHYDPFLDVEAGQPFTIYLGVFGVDDETELEQDFSSVSWVLHQTCCGAALFIQEVEYSPQFQHQGEPHFGVISSAEVCVDEPFITLATMSALLEAPEDGSYLVAAGPYQQAVDCEGSNPIVMGLPMTLNITGVGATPVEQSTWDALKATYR